MKVTSHPFPIVKQHVVVSVGVPRLPDALPARRFPRLPRVRLQHPVANSITDVMFHDDVAGEHAVIHPVRSLFDPTA